MSWKDNVREVVPYVPGEQPTNTNVIKLNTNENPYPPTQKVKEAIKQFDTDRLRLYPDPKANELVQTLAKTYGVNENNVFVGVGSDDVIGMSFLTFFNSDKPILFPDITYSFYSVWADLYKIPYERPALDDNFRIKKEDYYRENGGIIIPNPNAPTAIYEELADIEEIIKANKASVVIIDEAYIDFGGKSAVDLIKKYDNLLVVQTFSKSRSMAGMRIGFAIGNEELIKCLNDIKYSYNSYTMNMLSIKAGVMALEDEDYFKKTTRLIMNTRQRFMSELKAMGFEMTDSKTNFLFVTHKEYKAKDIYEQLRKENIFVRYFDLPRIDNHLRISIGTDEEMDILLKALKNYINI